MPKILFKTIPLLPTQFSVDVWICNDKSALANHFNKRYGASVDYYIDNLTPNQCMELVTTNKAELKSTHTIVVNMTALKAPVVVHEMNHVIHYLSKITGVEINQQCQEWHSYMLEYLFIECMKNNYKSKI